MALKSEPYYWIVCDRCGQRCDYGDFSAWAQADVAADGAEQSDWLTVEVDSGEDKHFCDRCIVMGEDGMEPMTVPVSADSGTGADRG